MASCDSEVKVGAEDVDSNFGGIGNSPGELASNLLLVVGEPFNVEQKDLILERIVTGKYCRPFQVNIDELLHFLLI